MTTLDFLLKHKEHLNYRISTLRSVVENAKLELEAVEQLIKKEKEADINPPQ